MIEFAENDGYLYDDGQPRIFTFKVNGRMFPCSADVTIGEFWKRVNAIPTVMGKGFAEPVDSRPGGINYIDPTAPTGPQIVQTRDMGKIERNDVVRFIGFLVDGVRKGDDEGEMVVGHEYRVMEVGKQTIAITDPDSDVPRRLTVTKNELELVRKGERVTHKREVFERTINCLCGETAALQLEGDVYKGVCHKCKQSITSKKEAVSA